MADNKINDSELTTTSKTINTVLVGKTGNGKSATGNSILGREAFVSDYGFLLVTCSSELQSTILNDGRIVNVIDTPGLFEFSTSDLVISREIIKCINLAKDGIHAVLMVFSIRSHFSIEDEAAFKSIKSLFGDNIVDYMIIVFTNGDILESRQKSWKDFISLSPEPMRNIIQLCKNRVIVFDNTTKDMIKREEQVNELLSLVESIIVDNGGKPYSNKIFAELKTEERVARLVAEERAARLVVEERAVRLVAEERATQLEAELGRESLKDEEIQKLKEDLNEIKKKYEESKKRYAKGQKYAII